MSKNIGKLISTVLAFGAAAPGFTSGRVMAAPANTGAGGIQNTKKIQSGAELNSVKSDPGKSTAEVEKVPVSGGDLTEADGAKEVPTKEATKTLSRAFGNDWHDICPDLRNLKKQLPSDMSREMLNTLARLRKVLWESWRKDAAAMVFTSESGWLPWATKERNYVFYRDDAAGKAIKEGTKAAIEILKNIETALNKLDSNRNPRTTTMHAIANFQYLLTNLDETLRTLPNFTELAFRSFFGDLLLNTGETKDKTKLEVALDKERLVPLKKQLNQYNAWKTSLKNKWEARVRGLEAVCAKRESKDDNDKKADRSKQVNATTTKKTTKR